LGNNPEKGALWLNVCWEQCSLCPKMFPFPKACFLNPHCYAPSPPSVEDNTKNCYAFITTIRRLPKDRSTNGASRRWQWSWHPSKHQQRQSWTQFFFCIASLGASSTANFVPWYIWSLLYSFLWRWRQMLELGAIAKVANLQCKMNNK